MDHGGEIGPVLVEVRGRGSWIGLHSYNSYNQSSIIVSLEKIHIRFHVDIVMSYGSRNESCPSKEGERTSGPLGWIEAKLPPYNS